MEKDLQKENDYLKNRIDFLENLIELNLATINISLNTNKELMDWLKSNHFSSDEVNSNASSTS